MSELEPRSGHAAVPYERGIPIRQVGRGVVSRFLPASLVSMGVVRTLWDFPTAGEWLQALGSVLGTAGGLAAGFALGVLGLHRWLYPDAEVAGRRSVVAGMLSPVVVFMEDPKADLSHSQRSEGRSVRLYRDVLQSYASP